MHKNSVNSASGLKTSFLGDHDFLQKGDKTVAI